MEKPRDARLLSRVFAAPRSQSWAKTRHETSGDARKTCFCYHFIYNFYASSTSESVQENSIFSVFSLSHARDKTKNIFLSFFTSTKLTIFLFHLQVIFSLTIPKIFIFSVRTVLQETKINISQ